MPVDTYLVTGGAGFIGSAVVRGLIASGTARVVNVDKLTYAGNLDSLASVAADSRYHFELADIGDAQDMRRILARYQPTGVLHLAAESHVDRSIDSPSDFVRTNVVGTFTLLSEAHRYWLSLDAAASERFRFLHVSTDEVFGSLGDTGVFTESSPYNPSSPYAATKAAADHLARVWHRTYGLPVLIANCSNNYGPFQFPEKLIPLTLLNALHGLPMPVYGRGEQVRDWLFVDDTVSALLAILRRGRAGETYVVSAGEERRNIDVAWALCDLMDELRPRPLGGSRRALVEFVADRPGHDQRYAIDASKLRAELGWAPATAFDAALRATVEWYLTHESWWQRVRSGVYRGERLGLGAGT